MVEEVLRTDVAFQKQRKLLTKEDDLNHLSNHHPDLLKEIDNLRVTDFTTYLASDLEMDEVNSFIRRYEWLGKPSLYPTHRFVCRHKSTGILAGVVTFDMPNAFSKILGKDTRKMERLISRGASISWAPTNLASWQIMNNIKWMVRNTRYRLFTAYSDPEAGELGTIYQACNFYYFGQKFGTRKMLYDPMNPDRGWFSDRALRSPSAYRKYARKLGVDWKRGDPIPNELRQKFNDMAKEVESGLLCRLPRLKHKYGYVLGRSKSETKNLRALLESKTRLYEYPKQRGV